VSKIVVHTHEQNTTHMAGSSGSNPSSSQVGRPPLENKTTTLAAPAERDFLFMGDACRYLAGLGVLLLGSHLCFGPHGAKLCGLLLQMHQLHLHLESAAL